MAIVQVLLAAVFRSAGRLLNTAFGWATTMLFGKVPQDRQIHLSILAFGSVLWLIAAVSVAFPSVGTFLLLFVTLPPWVDKAWIRIAMAAVAVITPAILGWVGTRMVAPEQRPKDGAAILKAIGRGYPFTIGLALTMVVMVAFAPLLKMRDMMRRWTSQHVPVIIEPEHYLGVLADLQRALETGGVKTTRRPAGFMLRFPTTVLTLFAHSSLASFMADQLTRLVSDKIEVLVHPADLVISGREAQAARARAILGEHLTYTRAYLTWDKEANDLEDVLRQVWDRMRADETEGVAKQLDTVGRKLRTLAIPYEEWEVLFRQLLLAERELLRMDSGALDRADVARAVATALTAAVPIFAQVTNVVKEMRKFRENGQRRVPVPGPTTTSDQVRELWAGVRATIDKRRARGPLARVKRALKRVA